MLCKFNEQVESKNFVDGVDFTKDDPCIFVAFQPGAAGDLLISIIDKHYLRTGCEYYGIDDNGKVHLYTTDYERIDIDAIKIGRKYTFDQQCFFNIAESLGKRNLNYSLLDQVIFGCHAWEDNQVEYILKTFPKAKVIRIIPQDQAGDDIRNELQYKKLNLKASSVKNVLYRTKIKNERILEIPFGSLFNETNYYKQYDRIINFLKLNGRLICFDYVQYYLSRQGPEIKKTLEDYSKTIWFK